MKKKETAIKEETIRDYLDFLPYIKCTEKSFGCFYIEENVAKYFQKLMLL
jgi:hypothetical protein